MLSCLWDGSPSEMCLVCALLNRKEVKQSCTKNRENNDESI
nr:MAG TPA: hypothetical protein [Caudoviricetes sp.]